MTDAGGVPLADGDAVTVVAVTVVAVTVVAVTVVAVTAAEDLEVRGSSPVVTVGTKVKTFRVTDGDHDIDGKIPGVGAMGLTSAFVRRADAWSKIPANPVF